MQLSSFSFQAIKFQRLIKRKPGADRNALGSARVGLCEPQEASPLPHKFRDAVHGALWLGSTSTACGYWLLGITNTETALLHSTPAGCTGFLVASGCPQWEQDVALTGPLASCSRALPTSGLSLVKVATDSKRHGAAMGQGGSRVQLMLMNLIHPSNSGLHFHVRGPRFNSSHLQWKGSVASRYLLKTFEELLPVSCTKRWAGWTNTLRSEQDSATSFELHIRDQ